MPRITRIACRSSTQRPLAGLADRWLTARLARKPRRESLLGDPGSPAVTWERIMMARAVVGTLDRVLTERLVSPHVLGIIARLWGRAILRSGVPFRKTPFERTHGRGAPWFLVVSPGHDCNLRCSDCYADSSSRGAQLPWSVLDRVISEAKSSWGVPLIVFSGGEPLVYRSEGHGLLDLVEKHPDLLYLMFTNGTLIDEEVAARLGRVGCVTPAISLEGMREETDARRGAGTFNRARKAMALLREAGVPFGVSLTATRLNSERLLGDEFLDFCFRKQGAFYGFLFMYMPMGRRAEVDLMPTPQQRIAMWRRTWEVVVKERLFLFDFWNQASLVHGCLAAGRPGGYFHIDWDGRVMPCVFAPYAGANVVDLFASGGDLDDVWRAPFFEGTRAWQRRYSDGGGHSPSTGNRLMPCPVRDHYPDFRACLSEYQPLPQDKAAADLLDDEEYGLAMAAYGRELSKLTGELAGAVYRR